MLLMQQPLPCRTVNYVGVRRIERKKMKYGYSNKTIHD